MVPDHFLAMFIWNSPKLWWASAGTAKQADAAAKMAVLQMVDRTV